MKSKNGFFSKKILTIITLVFLLCLFLFLIFIRQVVNRNKPSSPAPKPIIKVGPYVEITVTEKGFSPSDANLKKYGVVHFINNTSSQLIINPEGDKKIMVTPLAPGKTTISFVLDKTGVYIFSLKNNPSKKGKITVE